MLIYQTLGRDIWLATGKGSNSPSSTKISINRYNKMCPMHLSANMSLRPSGPSRQYWAKPLNRHTVQLYHSSHRISQLSPRMSFGSLTKFLSSRACRYGVLYRLMMMSMSEFSSRFRNMSVTLYFRTCIWHHLHIAVNVRTCVLRGVQYPSFRLDLFFISSLFSLFVPFEVSVQPISYDISFFTTFLDICHHFRFVNLQRWIRWRPTDAL